jgi:hypothetical protein
MTWLDAAPGMLCFTRPPGCTFAASLGPGAAPLPPHREILLASGPAGDSKLPANTAAWLASWPRQLSGRQEEWQEGIYVTCHKSGFRGHM